MVMQIISFITLEQHVIGWVFAIATGNRMFDEVDRLEYRQVGTRYQAVLGHHGDLWRKNHQYC